MQPLLATSPRKVSSHTPLKRDSRFNAVEFLLLAAEDYAPFNAVWNQPDGGLHTYLVRFLGSSDQTFQHIAVWVS